MSAFEKPTVNHYLEGALLRSFVYTVFLYPAECNRF